MTPIVIVLYSIAALILLCGALLGYKRGLGRSLVRLVYLAVIALVSFFVAKSVSATVSTKLMTFIHSLYPETLSTMMEANPNIETIMTSLITAIFSPFVFAVLFGLLELITLIFFKKISTGIVNIFTKGETKNVKAYKSLGMITGVVGAVIMIFALFSPITFTASILANTPPETLAAFDEILFATEDDFTPTSNATPGALAKGGKASNDFSLKDLRASLIVFSYLSADYNIEGTTQSIQREISNAITAAGDGIASFKASIESNPDDTISAYLNVVAAVGANTKHSNLITMVVKEASRAIANLEAETIESVLDDYTNYAALISTALPPLFEAIAETPDEELPETIEALFGTPPVEPVRDKIEREKEESKALKESVKESEKAAKEAEKVAKKAEKEAKKNGKKETEPAEPTVTEAPETKAPETKAPETEKRPETEKPTKPTDPTETKPPVVKPAETEPVETTAPKDDKEPENKDQSNTQNNGLIGSLINGIKDPTIKDTTVAEKGEMLADNAPLFRSIKETAFSIIASYNITDEKYAWIFDLIKAELETLLYTISENPNLSFSEKVLIFADALEDSKDTYMKESAYNIPGVMYITSPTAMQVVAIFGVDEFTVENYPDLTVPIEDIMYFMGITNIPDWVE